ncbi:vWA domain-containing protein [Holdemania massiliensis]|uniref:VWA domain-containing protein n=1 Tax=Holdemania massiliensis TaxID=1468449 RepID=A0A6N7SAJ7_9FIRM|nr:vWA domain-containing protein [Holdemania massiliensis]MSA72627.1 VWA domain-containing protein [Holdemania massiliensis]MSA90903.1 VWA domain-containing protein [Holdemania massiliensis]MSB79713.1 VWA domain-containing protein [Holdemania massiliensis]MSC34634.1 VWA domain-containing protein [Holdemania massiliensis]MSC41023.1 VWA domain-containing protein [Holdemania massiliensis]
MKAATEIVFILDRSGSMAGLESDTIGGFNALIEKQKRQGSAARISLILFDDQTDIVLDRVPIMQVGALSEDEYYVRGCTALLDAVGKSVTHISRLHQSMKKENRPEKTLFIITTDGMENSSQEYSLSQVKNLIEKQKERYHWEFLFLGANIDAVKTADSMGIRANRSANFHADEKGLMKEFKVFDSVISKIQGMEELDDDWAAELNADYDQRKKGE